MESLQWQDKPLDDSSGRPAQSSGCPHFSDEGASPLSPPYKKEKNQSMLLVKINIHRNDAFLDIFQLWHEFHMYATDTALLQRPSTITIVSLNS